MSSSPRRFHNSISSHRSTYGPQKCPNSFSHTFYSCTEELGAESFGISTGRSIIFLHDNNVEVGIKKKSTHDLYVNNTNFGCKETSGHTLNSQHFSPKACFLPARNAGTEKRRFPPPIKSLLGSDTTFVRLRSYKMNGRFVLVKVEVSSPKELQARRDCGRLRLDRIVHDTEEDKKSSVKPPLPLEKHWHVGSIDKFPHAIDESQGLIDRQIVAAKSTAPDNCCINLLAAQLPGTPPLNRKVLSIAKQVGPAPCVHCISETLLGEDKLNELGGVPNEVSKAQEVEFPARLGWILLKLPSLYKMDFLIFFELRKAGLRLFAVYHKQQGDEKVGCMSPLLKSSMTKGHAACIDCRILPTACNSRCFLT